MDPLAFALWTVPLAGAAGLFSFPWRSDYPERRWCLILLVPPLACLIWGQVFGVTPGHYTPKAGWKEGFLWACLFVSFVLGVMVTAKVACRFRLSGAMLSIAAFATTFLCGVLAAMQVSGSWI